MLGGQCEDNGCHNFLGRLTRARLPTFDLPRWPLDFCVLFRGARWSGADLLRPLFFERCCSGTGRELFCAGRAGAMVVDCLEPLTLLPLLARSRFLPTPLSLAGGTGIVRRFVPLSGRVLRLVASFRPALRSGTRSALR